MKTILFLITLVSSVASANILILPYGNWTLKGVSCSMGSRPVPGLRRGSRHDLHLLETGTFESAALMRNGWSVTTGTLTVDHATATLCTRVQGRTGTDSTMEPVTPTDPQEICGHYEIPEYGRLILTFPSVWDRQRCPESEFLRLTYEEIAADEAAQN